MSRRLYRGAVVQSVMCGTFAIAAPVVAAQGQQPRAPSPQIREASRLALDGQTMKARVMLRQVLDTISDPAAKADAQRAMAMSFAFAGDCANTTKYESLVIDYSRTREQADPGNAYYQEGEMADKAYDLATAHNPESAFVRRYARVKLNLPDTTY